MRNLFNADLFVLISRIRGAPPGAPAIDSFGETVYIDFKGPLRAKRVVGGEGFEPNFVCIQDGHMNGSEWSALCSTLFDPE